MRTLTLALGLVLILSVLLISKEAAAKPHGKHHEGRGDNHDEDHKRDKGYERKKDDKRERDKDDHHDESHKYNDKKEKRTMHVTWQFIWKLIEKHHHGKREITLDNGQRVKWGYVEDVLKEKKGGRSPEQLSESEKEVWQYAWNLLAKEGYHFQVVGGKPSNGKSASWQDLYLFLQQAENGPKKETKTKPVSWESIWEILMHHHKGNRPLKLSTGQEVSLEYLKKVLKETKTERTPEQLSGTETAAWKYIWELLEKDGYKFQIVGGKPHNGKSASWQDLYLFLQQAENGPKKETKTKPVSWESIWEILMHHHKGNRPLKLSTGQEVSLEYLKKVLKETKTERTPEQLSGTETAAWKYIWELLEKDGYKFQIVGGKPHNGKSASWQDLYLFLQQAENGPKKETKTKPVSWESIWEILMHHHKGNRPLKLSTGQEVSLEYLKKVLKETKTERTPEQLSGTETAAWKYIWELLEKDGYKFQIVGGKPHNGKSASWQDLYLFLQQAENGPKKETKTKPVSWESIWEILMHHHKGNRPLKLSTGQEVSLEYLKKVLKETKTERTPEQLSGTDTAAWKYIWELLEKDGYKFQIVGGKPHNGKSASWQDLYLFLQQAENGPKKETKTKPVSWESIWEILMHHHKGNRPLKLSTGQEVSLEYLKKVLKETKTERTPEQLSGTETAAWKYIWELLEKDGYKFQIVGGKPHNGKSASWQDLYLFLQQAENGPKKETKTVTWESIWEILMHHHKGNRPLKLSTGQEVSLEYLKKVLKETKTERTPEQLSGTDTAAWKYIWELLEKDGYKFQIVGGKPHNGKSASWQDLYLFLQQAENGPKKETKTVTWESIWEILMHHHKGNRPLKLSTGQEVSLEYLKKVLKETKTERTPEQLSGTERAAWKYIWELLEKDGYKFQIVGGKPHNGKSASWQDLYLFLQQAENGPKKETKTKPVSWESIWEILRHHHKGNRPLKLSTGQEVSLEYLNKVLKETKTERTPEQLSGTERAAWEYIWELLEKDGYKFQIVGGKPHNGKSASWQDLYLFLQQAENGPKKETKTKPVSWESIWEILMHHHKGNRPLKLSTGQEVSLEYLKKVLKETKTERTPEQLSGTETAAWKYIWELLEKDGYKFQIVGGKPHNGKSASWQDLYLFLQQAENGPKKETKTVTWESIWEILMHHHKGNRPLKLSTGQEVSLEYLKKVLKETKTERTPEQLSGTETAAWKYIWELLEKDGYKFQIVGGKPHNGKSASWQDLYLFLQQAGRKERKNRYTLVSRNGSRVTVQFIWDILEKQDRNKKVTLGNGKTVTWEDILATLNKDHLDNHDKYVLQFVWNFLQQEGYEFIDVNSKTVKNISWEFFLRFVTNVKRILQENDSRIDWKIIFSILKRHKTPRERVTLSDGESITWIELVKRFRKYFIRHPEHLNKEEEAISEYVYQVLQPYGITKTGLSNVKPQALWPYLLFLMKQQEKPQPTLTWQQIWSVVKEKHPEQQVVLNNGKTVTLQYLLGILKNNDGKQPEDLTDDERAAWDFILTTVHPQRQGLMYILQILDKQGKEQPESQALNYITTLLLKRGTGVNSKGQQPINWDFLAQTVEHNVNGQKPSTGTWQLLLDTVKQDLHIPSTTTPSTASHTNGMVYEFFVKMLNNPLYKNAELRYDGVLISLKLIIAKLDLKKDSSGKYITKDLTKDELYTVLQDIADSEKTSPEENETAETTPQPLEISTASGTNGMLYDFFVKMLNNPLYKNAELRYDGVLISLKLIIAKLDLKKDSSGKYITKDLTKDELYTVLQDIADSEKTSTEENETAETTPQPLEISTASHTNGMVYEFFVKMLNNPLYKNAELRYDGVLISLKLIIAKLDLKKDSSGKYITKDLTKDELYTVLQDIADSEKTSPEENETAETTPQPLEISTASGTNGMLYDFFVKMLNNPLYKNAELRYDGVLISLKLIIAKLDLKKDSSGKYITKDLTKDELYTVLQDIADSEKTSPEENETAETTRQPLDTTGEEAVAYQIINDIAANPDAVDHQTVTIDGEQILLIYFVKMLNLKKNPDTGHYIIKGISPEDIRRVALQYKQLHSTTTSSSASNSDNFILITFLRMIQNPSYVKYGKIKFDGVMVDLAEVIDKLGLEKDSSGKYITNNLTEDDLIGVLEDLADSQNSSPEENETAETTPQPLEISTASHTIGMVYDFFVKMLNNPLYKNAELRYDGVLISLKLIIAKLDLKKDSSGKYITKDLTKDELYTVLQDIADSEKTSTEENETAETTPQPLEISTASHTNGMVYEFFVKMLNNPLYKNAELRYDGVLISLKLIIAKLDLKKDSSGKYITKDLTKDELYTVLQDIADSEKTSPEENETAETTPQPLEISTASGTNGMLYDFFVKMLNNPLYKNAELRYDGVLISLKLIIAKLDLKKDSSGKYITKDLTKDELYTVLQDIADSEKTSPEENETAETTRQPLDTTGEEAVAYQIINDIAANPDAVDHQTVTIDGEQILLIYFVKMLNLKKNPDTGHYIIKGISPEDIRRVALQYKQLHSTTTSSSASNSDNFILITFLRMIQNPSYVKYGKIKFDGVMVDLAEVIDKLGLEKDSSGKYITNNLTEDDLIGVLEDLADSQNSSPEENETAETTPQPLEISTASHTIGMVYDFFVKMLNNPLYKNAELRYDGVLIPLKLIIAKLDLKKDSSGNYITKDLTKDELDTVLQDIAESERTSTTTSSSASNSDNFILITFLRMLQNPSYVKYGKIQFDGVMIDLADVIDKLSLEKDSSGKYITNNLTGDDLIGVLQDLADSEKTSSEENETAETTPQPLEISTASGTNGKVYDLVVNMLNNPLYKNAQLRYDGVLIPLKIIIAKLDLKKDSSGKYITKDLTKDDLYTVLQEIADSEKTSPEGNESTTSEGGLTPPVEDKEAIQDAVQYLKQRGNNPSGVVKVNDVEIPVSYIMDFLSLNNIQMEDLTADEFYTVVQAYKRDADTSTTEEPGSNTVDLTKEQQVTLRYILDFLNTKTDNKPVDLVFEGHRISSDFITNVLKVENVDITDASPGQLYHVINLFISNEDNSKTEELSSNVISVLQQILQYLKQQGPNASAKIVFNGQEIDLKDLESILLQLDIPIQEAKPQDLWRIIQLMIKLHTKVTSTNRKQATLQFFLQILRNPQDVPDETLVFDGYNVPVQYLVSGLDLQKDASGQYITSGISEDALWTLLQRYVQEDTSTTAQSPLTDQKTVVFRQFLSQLEDPTNIANVVLVVNGSRIPASVIVRALNLHIDSATGRYDVSKVTSRELWRILDVYLKSGTTISTVSSGVAQQQQQILSYFLQLLSKPEDVPNTQLSINGVKVPLQEVLTALGLHLDSSTDKYDTTNLTKESLWNVLIQYVNTVKTSGS